MGTIEGVRQGTNQTDSREVEREEIEMYVPEFWCGVFATILVETAILIVIAAFGGKKK